MAATIEYAVLDARVARLELGWKPRKPPAKPRPDHDWLKVHGRIRAPEGEWQFVDPCLTTDEVGELTDWLRTLTPDVTPPGPGGFIEQMLRFEALAAPRGMLTLRVRFLGEASPPWIWGDDDAVWGEGYWLEMTVTPKQLHAFADRMDRLIGRVARP